MIESAVRPGAFDQIRADAFLQTMLGVLNGGTLALMCSIGRTGLKALKPMLHMSRQDLWQLYMLGG